MRRPPEWSPTLSEFERSWAAENPSRRTRRHRDERPAVATPRIHCPARIRLGGTDGVRRFGEAKCASVRVDRRHGAQRDAHLHALAFALALTAGPRQPDLARD